MGFVMLFRPPLSEQRGERMHPRVPLDDGVEFLEGDHAVAVACSTTRRMKLPRNAGNFTGRLYRGFEPKPGGKKGYNIITGSRPHISISDLNVGENQ